MADAVEQALGIGELAWAEECAAAEVKATKKAGGAKHLAALRRFAAVVDTGCDDEDLPSMAAVVKAWRAVVKHPDATAADHAALAWAELLGGAPKKAKAALDEAAGGKPKLSLTALEAAVAWAGRRKDDKKRLALIAAAKGAGDQPLATRLLVQAHADAIALADQLAATREKAHPVWDPRVAEAVLLRVAAYRVAGQRERADEILDAWTKACTAALPDKKDPRRHVLDRGGAATPAESLARAGRRVDRALAAYGEESPALEQPLAAHSEAARHAGAHDPAIAPLRRLDALLAPRKGTANLEKRSWWLGHLRSSLLALRRFDEALAVADLEDQVEGERGRLVPNFSARAEILEARGDVDGSLALRGKQVEQWANAPAPYGPGSTNLSLARGWARQAYERAGRAAEGKRKFPEGKD